MFFEMRMTDIAQSMLKEIIKEGNIVIDATVGNGYDTIFLAERVGRTGKVYGFDIQEMALNNTSNKLNDGNLLERVELIQDSHEWIDKYVTNSIDAFMFNLGYLPGSDTSTITKAESSCKALLSCIDLLNVGGVGTVLCYYGHEGGSEEKEKIENILKNLPSNAYEVITIFNYNRRNSPPILHLIKKKK